MTRSSKRFPDALLIDIGNTSTTIGSYRNGRVRYLGRLDTAGQTAPAILRVLRQCAGDLRPEVLVIASVVPARKAAWSSVTKRLGCRAVWVTHKSKLGIPVTYPRPETIGPDRLANAVGASARFGVPVIVADFGTALTFDVVTKAEGYVGGIIAPGLPLMFSYLHEKTALLPAVGLGLTRHVTGKSTVEAMRLGAQWGYPGMVKEILYQLRRSPGLARAAFCATGGFAGKVLKDMKPAVRIDPQLTLRGLARIYELNWP